MLKMKKKKKNEESENENENENSYFDVIFIYYLLKVTSPPHLLSHQTLALFDMEEQLSQKLLPPNQCACSASISFLLTI